MRGTFLIALTAGILAVLESSLVAAPTTTIIPNGFGTAVSSSSGLYNVTGGTAIGGNLFHSFSIFNLGTGDTADFIVGAGTSNVLARVTGGASTIDGTITSTIGIGGPISNANLYFINPAGIMFTANASLNLGGAFVASTANYVKFTDGSTFYGDVNHPIQDAGLSSAPVSAFGFLMPTPAPISFTGSQITMAPGTGLQVISGGVSVDGASLLAPSGYLTLFSAASAGELPFDLNSPGSGFAAAPFSAFGKITVQNQSNVAIDGAGGGKVVIRGGKVVIDNSTISSANSGSGTGGDISIQADQLSMQNFARLTTGAIAGNAGNIMVHAGSFTMDGSNIHSFTELSDSSSLGHAGSVTVTVDGAFSMVDDSYIDSSTNTAGDGGNVVVHAGSFTMNGSIISSGVEYNATGNGGSIFINVDGALSLSGGSQFDAETVSSGNAGDVVVHAGSCTLDSGEILSLTTALEDANPGHGGSITVNVVGAFIMTDGALLDTVTEDYAKGDAGTIRVHAGSFTMDNSFISSGSEAPVPSSPGSSGSVAVAVDGALNMIDASRIDTNTRTAGNAGDVVVNAGSLGLKSGSEISSNTSGAGDAGKVTVQAGLLSISGSKPATPFSPLLISGITSSSDAFSTGNGGDVKVTAGNLTLMEGGTISASSINSDAGNILIDAEQLTLQSSSSIDTSAGGNGGSVTLNVGRLAYLLDSQIVATAGGNGGNITIDPQFVVLDNSLISANAALGEGGNIAIVTSDFLNQDSLITATGAANNGSITITAPNLDLGGQLIPLSSGLVTDERELRESCARAIDHEFSSLIVVGRNGTETAPDELQADFGNTPQGLRR